MFVEASAVMRSFDSVSRFASESACFAQDDKSWSYLLAARPMARPFKAKASRTGVSAPHHNPFAGEGTRATWAGHTITDGGGGRGNENGKRRGRTDGRVGRLKSALDATCGAGRPSGTRLPPPSGSWARTEIAIVAISADTVVIIRHTLIPF